MTAEPEPGVTTEELASAQERARRLWAAIDELPEKLRMAIVLASIEGHDVAGSRAAAGHPRKAP